MIVKERCPRCGTRLDLDRRCPGTYQLRIIKGERYATAAQLVHYLDMAMWTVRNWSRPDRGDPLQSVRVGRSVYFQFAHAARLERDKRLGLERPLDAALVSA